MRLVLLVALLSSVAGCASHPAFTGRDSIELRETPFFPQTRYQCGPAALATVLAAGGVAVTPDDLSPAVFTPGRKGSLQQDLIGATRAAGRLPYRIDPSIAALMDELESGRPVLVLQNLGVSWFPRWHYAVVVGFDAERRRVVLRSGTDRRRETRLDTFFRTWQRSDNWALTVLAPGQFPDAVDQQRYFAAVAALESVGDAQRALEFWTAAATRWPDSAVPLLGVANALMAAADYEGALGAFQRLNEQEHYLSVVRNNLALVHAYRGEFDRAVELIDAEIAAPESPDLLPVLRETRDEIVAMARERGGAL